MRRLVDSSSLQFDPEIERTCKGNRRQVRKGKKAKKEANIEIEDMNPRVMIEEVVDEEQEPQVPSQQRRFCRITLDQ